MNYNEALEFIHSFERFGIKPGNDRLLKLLERLGNPHLSCSFVHVAGTSGKGSTTHMLAAVLSEAGYNTGLYTSPYVFDFRERIQIDGTLIPKETLCALTERVRAHSDALAEIGICVSEFEFVTAVGFLYFCEQRCDIVCLEVGLGGLYDSTNVIDTPLVSVITPIGIDHTKILGDTIELIARQKCGIIKSGGITVSTAGQCTAALEIIKEECNEKNNPLIIPDERMLTVTHMGIDGSRFCYKGLDIKISLIGRHQIENAITAVETLFCLRNKGFSIPEDAIQAGLERLRIPGRIQVASNDPLIILDGAHNTQKLGALRDALQLLGGCPLIGVVGMLKGKDYEEALSPLLPLFERVAVTVPESPLAMNANTLHAFVRQIVPETAVCANVHEAIGLARKWCPSEGAIVVFGSFYLISELGGEDIEDFMDGTKGSGEV